MKTARPKSSTTTFAILVLIVIVALIAHFTKNRSPRLPAEKLKTIPEILSESAVVKKSIEPTFIEERPNEKPQAEEKIDLQEILLRNDACALMRIMDQPLDHSLISEHLLANNDLLPHSNEENTTFEILFKRGGGTFSKSITDETKNLKFYNALFISDQLEGLKPLEVDLAKAELLLMELVDEDPDNGAYSFFLAPVKAKLARSKSEIESELQKALYAPSFDTFSVAIAQRIWERGLQDSASMVAARILISKMPIPNYLEPKGMVLNYAKEHPEQIEALIGFSKRLMRPGIHNAPHRDELIFWSGVEYSIANRIYSQAWTWNQSGKPPEPEYTRPYSEMIKLKKPTAQELTLGSLSQSSEQCPTEIFEDLLQNYRKELLEMPRNSH